MSEMTRKRVDELIRSLWLELRHAGVLPAADRDLCEHCAAHEAVTSRQPKPRQNREGELPL